MNNDAPYWHKLTSYWVRVRKRNGLTIPFLIGAEQFDKPDQTIEPKSVSELLTEIINSDTGDTMTLLYCTDIGDYVLGLNNSCSPMSGTEVKNEKNNKTTLIASLSTQILGNNIKDVMQSLTTKYEKCLQDKKYSLIKSQWTDFDENDRKMIKEALQK